jgi:hypothetical protein
MAYIEQDDFEAYAPNTTIDETEFLELAERASEIIDALTLGRIIRAGGLEYFDTDVQAAIKKAVCAEVHTLYAQGGLDAITGNLALGSASIGKFSYSAGFAGQLINGMPVSPLVSTYLRQTGLMYRGRIDEYE